MNHQIQHDANDMPHLQDAISLLGELDQFGGLGRVIGHWLFHQDVPALLEQRFGQLEVRRRRRSDAYRVTGRRSVGHAPWRGRLTAPRSQSSWGSR